MTIASAIQAKQQQVAAAYTAISNKGGTLPATQDLSNMPNAINTISTVNNNTLTVTPTTSQQTYNASGGYTGYNPVTVNAVTSAIDSNIAAGNIKSGVNILGVNGSVVELAGETRNVSITSTSGNTFTPTSGKNGITSITVTPTNQNRTVTPTTSQQTLSVNSGYSGNGTITVNAVTSAIDSNIQPQNIKKDVVILGTTGTFEGGGGGKYQLLQRVKDDNNADVGIVSGFFTDANDTEYAVVCLDAVNRTPANYATWCTNQTLVTNLPAYQNQTLWSAKETATFNTQKILDFLSGSYTSGACTICRSKSFVIDGITYYGQLPNIMELVDIFRHRIEINSSDPTASSYSTKIIPTATIVWSSSQVDATLAFMVNENGTVGRTSKNYGRMAIPVLEIPNT